METEESVDVKNLHGKHAGGSFEEGKLHADNDDPLGQAAFREPCKTSYVFYFKAATDISHDGFGPSVPNHVKRPVLKEVTGNKKRKSKKGLRGPGPPLDLNLSSNNRFDLDRIIWKQDASRSALKRKASEAISHTFLPEVQQWKKLKSKEAEDFTERKVCMTDAEEKGFEHGDVETGFFEVEIKETMKVGAMIGVDLEGFQEDVRGLVVGDSAIVCDP
ncbi:hypothetical protein HanHA300_Chr01g0006401 [Helianthus annuus]|nr:hypothetical protein HanHA300_Chr01g0006401 [Helianthus annuus]KAJ0625921.1 hypothetical protein HanHA89_Chr01g0007071 [Helianthus annuus]KAJ0782275.1 hypothetical protein HanLR1_Chr01g0006221 [Helianthus annuus]